MPDVPAPAAGETFPFRGVRGMRLLLGASTVLLAAGVVGMAWAALTGGAWPLLATALFLAVVVAYLVRMFVELPSACAVVTERELYVRFPGAVDAAMARSSVHSAALADHRWWQGLGIRSDLMGTVMLATAAGSCAQFELAEPLRVWVIPRILPIRARRLRLSVRNPERLIAYFPPSAPADHQES
jgi:hypothetical protein